MTDEKNSPADKIVGSTDGLDAETLADAERFQWLLKRGLAWRGCYDAFWREGEWLYAEQNGRHEVDIAMSISKASNAD